MTLFSFNTRLYFFRHLLIFYGYRQNIKQKFATYLFIRVNKGMDNKRTYVKLLTYIRNYLPTWVPNYYLNSYVISYE